MQPAAAPAASAAADLDASVRDAMSEPEVDAGALVELDAGSPAPTPPAPSGHGSTSWACPVGEERELGLDDPTALGTARALRDAFSQAVDAFDPRETPFRWAPRFGGTTTIVIADITWGDKARYTGSDQPGCEDLRMPASIHFVTQDGSLDETAQGWVRGTQFVGSYERQGKLSEWLVEQAQHPGLEIQSISVVFNIDAAQKLIGGELNATSDTNDDTLSSDLYGLGKFDATWARGVALDAPYVRVAPIDELCAAAEPADMSVSFSPGIPDLSSKLNKVWLRCDGMSTGFPNHDGLVITTNGWKHIAFREGAWVEQLGFGHEGAIEILDTSINGPGSQQVAFWDMLPFTFASPSVELSRSATSLRLAMGGRGTLGFEGQYVTSDVTPAAAQLSYADGERAGAAACDQGEAHLHRAGAAALAGAWTFCSGSFRPDATGIEFTALGTYNHVAANGDIVASGLYQVIDTGDFNGAGSSQIDLNDFDGASHVMSVLLQSDAPVKLSFGLGDGRGVLSGL